MTLTFLGHVTSSVMWPFDSPYPMSLTFLGHVTSSVMWPFDSPYPISYSTSIVTKPLSPALLEILGLKYNWVTTLTFLGHVTSSVMWPFDSPYPISYSCFIVTKALSLTVFEILGSKVPVMCKSSLRMRDITWPVPPMQNLGTYLNFPPPHCQFTMTLLFGSDEE